jgi:hypothetical protein
MSAFVQLVNDHNQAWILYPGDVIGRGDRAALRLADPAASEFAAGISLREISGVPRFIVLAMRSPLRTDRHGICRDLPIGVDNSEGPDLQLHERFTIGKERLHVAQVHIPVRRPALVLGGREVLLPMADVGVQLEQASLCAPGEGAARVRFDRVGWAVEEGGVRTVSLTDGVDLVPIGSASIAVRWRDVAGVPDTALASPPIRVHVYADRVEVSQGGATTVWDCTESERELLEAATTLFGGRSTFAAEDLYRRLHPDVRSVSHTMVSGMQRGTWHRAMRNFPFRPPLEWAQRQIRVAPGVVVVDER